MRTALSITGAVLLAAFLGLAITSRAEQGASDGSLAEALKQAQLPLERGLAASAREGKPISAKYELEDDDADELQLSVYTAKEPSFSVDFETGDVSAVSSSFAEVIVDYTTAKVVKVIPIKDGEDLAAARNQSKAMANATSSTAQDLARGRVTEIDSLNGYVSRRGRELGVPTPVNSTLHALVKLLELKIPGG